MATLFHLIRHGAYGLLDQGFGGREPHSLSAEGIAQAERIAARFQASPPAAVITSPVQRAKETAEPIANRLGLPLQLDLAFAEIDFAGWTGKRFSELHGIPEWRAWNVFRGTAGIPGGETMHAVQGRALAALIRVAGGYPDAEVVIVTHADIIKGILAHFLGAPLDLMRRMDIGPGSTSLLRLYAEDAKVLAVNLPP